MLDSQIRWLRQDAYVDHGEQKLPMCRNCLIPCSILTMANDLGVVRILNKLRYRRLAGWVESSSSVDDSESSGGGKGGEGTGGSKAVTQQQNHIKHYPPVFIHRSRHILVSTLIRITLQLPACHTSRSFLNILLHTRAHQGPMRMQRHRTLLQLQPHWHHQLMTLMPALQTTSNRPRQISHRPPEVLKAALPFVRSFSPSSTDCWPS